MYQDIEYNETLGSSLKVFSKELITVPAAKRRKEATMIPGRNGMIYSKRNDFEETEIKIPFNYIGPENMWNERWRKIQKWLSICNSRLIISDDPEYFFRISHVLLDDNVRKSNKVGDFVATFVTKDGLHYLKKGLLEYEAEAVKLNPYEESMPIYKILGEGKCTLEVNGKTMIAQVGQNLTVDTERMISYRADGTLQNTEVTGDYEDLYLKEGKNTIKISQGFQLKVIPNWWRL